MVKKPPVQQEGRILLAIDALKNKKIKSIRAAARIFDVPMTTLYGRMKGHPEVFTTYNNKFKMTQIEEESLVQWIMSMGKRGMPPRPSHVEAMANNLIARRGEQLPSSPVGKNWVQGFLKRHMELTTKFIRKYAYLRAKCEDPKVVQHWFNQYLEIKAQYGILDEDTYNFDETGFAMGVIATAKVVTSSETFGKPPHTQPGNREWVTAIESINACGWALPPMVIFKGKLHQQALTDLLPEDWRIEWSDNGWTNNRIGLEWLSKTFEPATRDKTKGQYRMLILDGHGSHVAPEFDVFCSQHNIIPICMPAHSSHLLQPLDVTCFSVLKRMYGAQVETKMSGKVQHIDKEDFLEIYPIARQQTFKSTTIRNGFLATGLIPYEPEHVLSKLRLQVDHTPTPPGSIHSSNSDPRWIPETPHNTVQLQHQSQTIQRLLREQNSPPTPTKAALNQLVKGCELAMHNAVFLAKEIEELKAVNAAMQRKLHRTRQRIVHTGSLTRQEAQVLIQSSATGQNVIGVTNPSASTDPLQQPLRRPPKCSGCGIEGHKINKCPQLASH